MPKVYLDIIDIEALVDATTNLRDNLLVRLLFHLGCRISEVLSTRVDDIDFTQHTVTLIHLKRRIKLSCSTCRAQLGAHHVFCPSCGGKIEKSQTEEQEHRRQRVLPLDNETLKLLKEYIERGGPIVKDGKKLIFGVNRHRAWQIINECAKRAGLPNLINPETGKIHGVSPHRLRDAFATHAVKLNDSGDGLRLLQEHLGHQNFNTTAKYRKVAGEEHREWYEKLWHKEKP